MTKDPQKPNVLPGMERFLPPPEADANRPFDDLTAREIATLYGVTVQALDGWRRTGCPSGKKNGRLQFNLAAVIQWRRARDRSNAAPDGEDPFMSPSAGDSPALEDYRGWKAKLAELDYQRRKGEVLDRADLELQFRLAGSTLARALENLERAHGRAIGDAIRDALSSVMSELGIDLTAPAEQPPANGGPE